MIPVWKLLNEWMSEQCDFQCYHFEIERFDTADFWNDCSRIYCQNCKFHFLYRKKTEQNKLKKMSTNTHRIYISMSRWKNFPRNFVKVVLFCVLLNPSFSMVYSHIWKIFGNVKIWRFFGVFRVSDLHSHLEVRKWTKRTHQYPLCGP